MRKKKAITKDAVLVIRQILLTISIRNAWGIVRKICIFISGLSEFQLIVEIEIKLRL